MDSVCGDRLAIQRLPNIVGGILRFLDAFLRDMPSLLVGLLISCALPLFAPRHARRKLDYRYLLGADVLHRLLAQHVLP